MEADETTWRPGDSLTLASDLHRSPPPADGGDAMIGEKEYDVLSAIAAGNSRFTDIKRCIKRDPVKLLQKLKNEGYIQTKVNTKENGLRDYVYSLTPAGEAILTKPRESYVSDAEKMIEDYEKQTETPQKETPAAEASAEDLMGRKAKQNLKRDMEFLRKLRDLGENATVVEMCKAINGDQHTKSEENVIRARLKRLENKGMVESTGRGNPFKLTETGSAALIRFFGVVVVPPTDVTDVSIEWENVPLETSDQLKVKTEFEEIINSVDAGLAPKQDKDLTVKEAYYKDPIEEDPPAEAVPSPLIENQKEYNLMGLIINWRYKATVAFLLEKTYGDEADDSKMKTLRRSLKKLEERGLIATQGYGKPLVATDKGISAIVDFERCQKSAINHLSDTVEDNEDPTEEDLPATPPPCKAAANALVYAEDVVRALREGRYGEAIYKLNLTRDYLNADRLVDVARVKMTGDRICRKEASELLKAAAEILMQEGAST